MSAAVRCEPSDLAAMKQALRLFDADGAAETDLSAAVRTVVENNRPRNYSVCHCGSPLVSTLEFRMVEWFCQECGALAEFLRPAMRPWSQELEDRHLALDAEFRRHAEDRAALDRTDPARLVHAREHLTQPALADGAPS